MFIYSIDIKITKKKHKKHFFCKKTHVFFCKKKHVSKKCFFMQHYLQCKLKDILNTDEAFKTILARRMQHERF